MKRFITVCAISAAMTAGTAFAETVKVGYMTTLSGGAGIICLLYTSPSPRDYAASRMPSSA